MSLKTVAWLITGLWAGLALPVAAQGPEPQWTPQSVTVAVEAAASASSFSQLEQFGRDSLKLSAPERLRRLDHVAWIFVNQSDYPHFGVWNGVLTREAHQARSHRYEMVAELNGLRGRYDQGDATAVVRTQAIADTDPDWYPRVFAMTIQAYMLMREARIGDALQRLADADASTPDHDPMATTARSRIWQMEALSLTQLRDLKASAVAYGRTQFEYGERGYPRPDYDSLYTMAVTAAQLGDQALAERLVRAHHRLSVRDAVDVPSLRVWDKTLCATVAQHAAPRQVLACLNGLDILSKTGDAHFLARRLLPLRAIAFAKLGDVADASRDLEALKTLRASKAFPEAQFEKLPLVEAAVLHARGQDAAAYAMLSAYGEAHEVGATQQFSAGIAQITGEMQKELGARREQLATARRNATLQHDVIASQKALDIGGAAVVLAVVALLFWQWRVAGQLRRARRAAEAANQAKSDFLANMSHEIRTPLNGVVAVADMLTRTPGLTAKALEMAEIIRASGDTLQRLLSDILDVARIESGKITIEATTFNAGDMVRSVAGLSQLKCDEKGVALELEIAPEIDQAVIGDAVRVRQVVTNLLNNAVKFTEAGAVRLTAERMATGLARFTVTDTGVGFAMADKGKVLGRFEQADSSITRRFGGTGLGLSICCDLARLMGGVLDCDSQPGVGSRFWLELPLEPSTLAAETEAPSSDAQSAGVLRILLADDHPTNRKVVELMLDGGPAELISVEDGAKALEMLGAQPFDLILMDMQMPVMDGLSAIREIRRIELSERLKRTPVIMLTANALPQHVAEARAAGADLHLAKPFTAAALFEAINAALDGGAQDEGGVQDEAAA